MSSSNITRRPNGRWRARYRDDTGHEHARHFDTRAKGQAWLDTITADIVVGNYVDPNASKITFRAYYDEWSARQIWESGTKAAMDYAAYSTTFVDLEMGKIRLSHVEQWVKLMSKTLAASTVHTRFRNVRAVLRAAVADRKRADDPTVGVKLPALRRAEAAMRIPTPEQVGALIEASDDDLAPLVATCSFAGLREGEAAALQVGDIDFMHRTIQVQRQVQDRGSVEIRAPKYGSERPVYVPDGLLMILSEHIARRGIGGDPEAWLFVDHTGEKPVRSNRVNDRWRAACNRAAVSGYTLHDLRHFFASGLIAAGCDVVTVQHALGHSAPSVTLDTYSHLWPTGEDKTRTAVAGIMAATFPVADSLRTAETEAP
jgi:integrase